MCPGCMRNMPPGTTRDMARYVCVLLLAAGKIAYISAGAAAARPCCTDERCSTRLLFGTWASWISKCPATHEPRCVRSCLGKYCCISGLPRLWPRVPFRALSRIFYQPTSFTVEGGSDSPRADNRTDGRNNDLAATMAIRVAIKSSKWTR
jgi:hypothetical protein